jgi:hypothetical protein
MQDRWVIRMVVAGMAAFALGELVCTGCGILSAPISVPAAIAANDSPALAGRIVNDLGQPLDNVTIRVSTRRVKWEPFFGQQDAYSASTLSASGVFNVPAQRGASMRLDFERAGYRARTVTVLATKMEQSAEGGRSLGTWPRQKEATVVLERVDAALPRLILASEDVAYAHGSGLKGIDLAHPGALYLGPVMVPHLFYATPEGLDALPGGLPDPPDRDLPRRMIFRINDPDGGFALYSPHFGQDELAQMQEAPESGYVPELVLERKQLDKLRAVEGRGIEQAVLFYFRADGRYGKGMIRWDRQWSGPESPVRLHYLFLFQPTRGERDVRSSEALTQK